MIWTGSKWHFTGLFFNLFDTKVIRDNAHEEQTLTLFAIIDLLNKQKIIPRYLYDIRALFPCEFMLSLSA